MVLVIGERRGFEERKGGFMRIRNRYILIVREDGGRLFEYLLAFHGSGTMDLYNYGSSTDFKGTYVHLEKLKIGIGTGIYSGVLRISWETMLPLK